MKLKPLSYTNLNSKAIESITIEGNNIEIVFKSSDKSYNYTIIDTEFVQLLDNTIKNGESVGKFVNLSLKEEKIKQIQTNSK